MSEGPLAMDEDDNWWRLPDWDAEDEDAEKTLYASPTKDPTWDKHQRGRGRQNGTQRPL